MSLALSLRELESIERFVSFLQCRVRTDSLELLPRFAREIHHSAVVPAQSPALHAFITTGATQIAVLPLPANDDGGGGGGEGGAAAASDANARATQLLQEQRERVHPSESPVRPTFFVWIEHCVLTKNWPWLVAMFVEFVHGQDDCLQTFLRNGVQAVSAMPCARWEIAQLAPQPPVKTEPHHGPQLSQPLSSAPAPVSRPSPSPSPSSSPLPSPLTEDAAASSPTPSTPAPAAPSVVKRKRGRPPRARHEGAAEQKVPLRARRLRLNAIAQSVLREVAALAKSKPWCQLYDTRTLSYPFDAAALPDVAERFRTFWATHARAVWERNVWVPVDSLDARRTRKCRQDFASRSFETNVIMPLYNALGAQFFVDLDARAEPHAWWWYRRPVVDVTVLVETEGDDAALAYVRRSASDRFLSLRDDLPRGRAHNHQRVSASMWSTHAKCAPLLREIQELKDAAS
ncbi:hypothetical protein PINS_up003343 [Pythium insidiosum]|nr:hypothetical protein PINS_up003343 [Pythium insidiosum]